MQIVVFGRTLKENRKKQLHQHSEGPIQILGKEVF